MPKKKTGPKNPWKWTEAAKEKCGLNLRNWFDSDHTNLFYKKFAHSEYDLSWQSLYASCKDNDQFLVAYRIVKEIQEYRLAEGGLNGELNPSMANNALKNVSNWRDRTEHSSDPDAPLIQTIERIIIKNEKGKATD